MPTRRGVGRQPTGRSPSDGSARRRPEKLGLLTPAAFEDWVGQRFRDLGYEVQMTPAQGDHGIDLLASRPGETVVVQCKHWPGRPVGEPVLRDLMGTLIHVGGLRAVLVTTGSATPAAPTWTADKPIDVWDWPVLAERWSKQIAEATAKAAAEGGGPPAGWYVYTDDRGTEYAVKLAPAVGDYPALGRALAAQRERVPKTCAVCGKAIEGVVKSRYCSLACNQKAYWDRKRPELNARGRVRYQRQKDAGQARPATPAQFCTGVFGAERGPLFNAGGVSRRSF